jgi:hypothetical protein
VILLAADEEVTSQIEDGMSTYLRSRNTASGLAECDTCLERSLSAGYLTTVFQLRMLYTVKQEEVWS